MSFKVEMIGDDVAIRKLGTLTGFVNDEAVVIIGQHVKEEVRLFEKTPYVAELPNQVYQRTGELGRSFGRRKSGRIWQLFNNRFAAKFVIGRGTQNEQYHAWRWWTMQAFVEERLPKLVKRLLEGVDDVFNE